MRFSRRRGRTTNYPSRYTVLRPVTKLMINTITATTNNRWIKLPAMWKPNPNNHRINRIAKIVQSILVTSGQQSCGKQ